MAKTQPSRAPASQATRRTLTVNRAVRATLHSPLHHLIDQAVCELHLHGRRTGHSIELPVQYARYGGDIVILVGASTAKTWWRNFITPHPVWVRLDGTWRPGIGRSIRAGHPGRRAAVHTYLTRFPHALIADADPIVVVTLLPMDTAAAGTRQERLAKVPVARRARRI